MGCSVPIAELERAMISASSKRGRMPRSRSNPSLTPNNGTPNGKVLHVGNDALNDEKRGLAFLTHIKLGKATMRLEERECSLHLAWQ